MTAALLACPDALGLAVRAAWGRVAARRSAFAGADGVAPAAFAAGLGAELERLADDLAGGAWRPRPLRRVVTADGRALDVPAVRDRVVEAAALGWLRPRVEPALSDAAYAYRPGRGVAGAHAALGRHLRGGTPPWPGPTCAPFSRRSRTRACWPRSARSACRRSWGAWCTRCWPRPPRGPPARPGWGCRSGARSRPSSRTWPCSP